MQIKYTKNGIMYKTNSISVNLDPKRIGSKSINFVSHAHKDHLPSNSNNDGLILTSVETTKIANLYGISMKNFKESLDGFSLIDTDHVIGSKGLLFNDIFILVTFVYDIIMQQISVSLNVKYLLQNVPLVYQNSSFQNYTK